MFPQGRQLTVDGGNRFAVPGYNNMHSHALIAERPEFVLTTMLAEGVTGFRHMSGTPKLLRRGTKGAFRSGSMRRICSRCRATFFFRSTPRSPKEARAEVDRQKRQNADFIKIILAPCPAFFAAINEAHRLGLPTAGHLPPDVSPLEASRAGFDSIEHFALLDRVFVRSNRPAATRAGQFRHRALPGARQGIQGEQHLAGADAGPVTHAGGCRPARISNGPVAGEHER
jgi:imidazolonepropionase-like amidohydrolase